MDHILTKLLNFRGINNVNELDQEEKAQFDQWRAILDKEDIGIKDILEFSKNAIKSIEKQFEDPELSQRKMESLVVQHTIYRKFVELIEAPKLEKESLIKYLTDLMK